MGRKIQQRTLETRGRLIAVSRQLVSESGYDALRIEDVVSRAGVAKGTFFAHFSDKEFLMDLLIGAAIDAHLDEMEAAAPPGDVEEFVARLLPRMSFIASERYVFDIVLRRSGAAAVETIGPIALTFERYIEIVMRWLENGPFRKDVSVEILAEGVQAFETQALALNFCAIHNCMSLEERLRPYLRAWLRPHDFGGTRADPVPSVHPQ